MLLASALEPYAQAAPVQHGKSLMQKQKSRFLTNAPFAPMMAPELKSLRDIVYPVIIMPRIKGERCVVRNGTPLTKRLTPFPNKTVQTELSGLPDFDGMLQVTDSNSGDIGNHLLYKQNIHLTLNLMVFDVISGEPYYKRLNRLEDMEGTIVSDNLTICVPKWVMVNNKAELDLEAAEFVEQGYVYLVVSDPYAGYNHGMCTYVSGIRYVWNIEKV